MHHYPHHIGDYSKDTPGLTMAEHGAYRLLMDAYYASETPIPEDEPYAIAKAATPQDRKAVDKVLRKYFDLRDGGYHQKRIDAELEIYREKAEKNRVNGALGGRPRNNPEETQTKPRNNPNGFQNETQTVTQTEPKHNPEITLTNNQEPITKEQQRRASRLPPDWRASTSQIEWAIVKRPDWDAEHVLLVAERFRNHWTAKAGRDATKLDWDATWRNWVLNEHSAPSYKPKPADKFAGAI